MNPFSNSMGLLAYPDPLALAGPAGVLVLNLFLDCSDAARERRTTERRWNGLFAVRREFADRAGARGIYLEEARGRAVPDSA
jgi:hypothetical protein